MATEAEEGEEKKQDKSSDQKRRFTRKLSKVFKKEDFAGIKNLFKSLPDYVAISLEASKILKEGQILVLNYHLPGYLRMCNWRLLYSLERDGYSYLNFFEKL